MADYRRAEMVELHDAGIVIQIHTASEESNWREYYQYAGQSYHIEGEILQQIAQHLGLDLEQVTETTRNHKGEPVRTKYSLKDRDLKIDVMRTIIGQDNKISDIEFGWKIDTLLVKVEGPQLIHIQPTFTFEQADENDNKQTREITYSGRYTIWWSPEPYET